MRGVVFTEFFKMVDKKFSVKFTEPALRTAKLKSGGIDTATGNFRAGNFRREKIARLVLALLEKTSAPPSKRVRIFAKPLPGCFAPGDFDKVRQALFLPGGKPLEVTYKPAQPLANLARELIQGCIGYFGAPIAPTRHDGFKSFENKPAFLLVRE